MGRGKLKKRRRRGGEGGERDTIDSVGPGREGELKERKNDEKC